MLNEELEPEENSDSDIETRKAKAQSVKYTSRGDKKYIDEESQDNSSDSGTSAKSMKLPRTNINYLKAQEHNLQLQIEKNRQLIEIEKQKAAIGANADSDVKPN